MSCLRCRRYPLYHSVNRARTMRASEGQQLICVLAAMECISYVSRGKGAIQTGQVQANKQCGTPLGQVGATQAAERMGDTECEAAR